MTTDQPAEEPAIVQVPALDVTPYKHAIWCQIEDGEPFANTIVVRRWSEDGSEIWFMLDSHNFYSAKPDALVDVVETGNAYRPSYDHGRAWFEERRPERIQNDVRPNDVY